MNMRKFINIININGDDIYFWDDSYATHGHIAEMVWPSQPGKIYWEDPKYVDSRIYIERDCDDRPTIDFDEELWQHPRYMALLKSNELYIKVPGAGCMNYLQYMAYKSGRKDWYNVRG
jgi:hypothetical protein